LVCLLCMAVVGCMLSVACAVAAAGCLQGSIVTPSCSGPIVRGVGILAGAVFARSQGVSGVSLCVALFLVVRVLGAALFCGRFRWCTYRIPITAQLTRTIMHDLRLLSTCCDHTPAAGQQQAGTCTT
jgi:hypothetical protein